LRWQGKVDVAPLDQPSTATRTALALNPRFGEKCGVSLARGNKVATLEEAGVGGLIEYFAQYRVDHRQGSPAT
jgi:hypothetical protein